MSEDPQLDALLAAHADGVLDEAGAAELGARLAADPAARRRAARWFAQERQLHDLHACSRRRGRWRVVAALAAALLLAAGVLAWTAWPRPVLGRCRDGVLVAGRADAAIRPGDEVTAAAVGAVLLPDGSRLELDPGCVLGFPADAPPLLRAGRLTAEVVPQPAGRTFAIATPQSLVDVVGTRFSVAVAEGRSTVAVESGRVRVTDRAAGWVRELLPGGGCASGVEAPPLVPREAQWRIRDGDEAAPPGWAAPDFDDAPWRRGRGPFGFGAKARGVATPLDEGAGPKARHMTAYFRHRFVAGPAEAAAGLRLRLRWRVDDGLVVHLNGDEVLRHNMPAGPVGGATAAQRVVGDGSERWYERILPGLLRPGLNLLAVEVHQGHRSSSDLLFDLEATAVPVP